MLLRVIGLASLVALASLGAGCKRFGFDSVEGGDGTRPAVDAGLDAATSDDASAMDTPETSATDTLGEAARADVARGDVSDASAVDAVEDTSVDAMPDGRRFGAPVTFDLAQGFLMNVAPSGTNGADAGIVTQSEVDGWSYRVDLVVPFGTYGPLPDTPARRAGYSMMPLAWNTSTLRAWGCNSTTVMTHWGEKGALVGSSWTGMRRARAVDPVDSVTFALENRCQPVVAWRAPSAGRFTARFEITLELGCTVGSIGDVEVHLASTNGGTWTEHARAYVGCGTNDANGRPTVAISRASPFVLTVADQDIAGGDHVFTYARIGDDDGGDAIVLRGSIVFEPGL